MKKSLLLTFLPVSIFIVLLTCIGLRKALKEYKVAKNGIKLEMKISNLRKVEHFRRGDDYYADFIGAGVQMEREVSEEFYFTHRINDEVTMKYMPNEDIILYGYESGGDSFVVRGIFIIIAIAILVVARRKDVRNAKERNRKKERAERDQQKR